ncbi:MAG: DUF1993 domain-containing protein [Burkholderiales bacterium]
MPLSMYQASVPVFVRNLDNLSAILDKAVAHAEAKKIDHAVLLNFRLFPDMLNFIKQIQIATDFAKGASARLAGLDVPKYEDSETSFADLKARIQKTVAFVQSVSPAQIDGSEERDITLTVGGNPLTLKGQPYLLHMVMPNFYFHSAMAYAILRHNGVEIGKRDFVPMPS